MTENIKRCPFCGRDAYVMHDKIGGEYDFGWSVGCSAYSLKTLKEHHYTSASKVGFRSRDDAIAWWNDFCNKHTRERIEEEE